MRVQCLSTPRVELTNFANQHSDVRGHIVLVNSMSILTCDDITVITPHQEFPDPNLPTTAVVGTEGRPAASSSSTANPALDLKICRPLPFRVSRWKTTLTTHPISMQLAACRTRRMNSTLSQTKLLRSMSNPGHILGRHQTALPAGHKLPSVDTPSQTCARVMPTTLLLAPPRHSHLWLGTASTVPRRLTVSVSRIPRFPRLCAQRSTRNLFREPKQSSRSGCGICGDSVRDQRLLFTMYQFHITAIASLYSIAVPGLFSSSTGFNFLCP